MTSKERLEMVLQKYQELRGPGSHLCLQMTPNDREGAISHYIVNLRAWEHRIGLPPEECAVFPWETADETAQPQPAAITTLPEQLTVQAPDPKPIESSTAIAAPTPIKTTPTKQR